MRIAWTPDLTITRIGVAALYYMWPLDRSLFVEATMEEVTVVFETDVSWRLPDAVVCRALIPRRGGSSVLDSDATPCSSSETMAVEAVTRVEWQAETSLSIRREGQGAPYIQVVTPSQSTIFGSSDIDLSTDDRIVLPPDFGPFQAVGTLMLGSANSGGPMLLTGSYE